jgi:integrative and conjugative element protein (TIGR02256 family)
VKYRRPIGGCLEFGPDAWACLVSFVQQNLVAKEAGGVLLGRMVEGTDDILIDEVTKPGVHDSRSRFHFVRSRKTAQGLVDRAWQESARSRIYLGEWHTHPEDDPRPSNVDMRNQQNVLRSATYEQGFLFFVIAGRLRVRVWEGSKSGEVSPCIEIVPVEPIAND